MTQAQRKKMKQLLQTLQRELTKKSPELIDSVRPIEAEPTADEDEQPLNEMLQAIASNRNKNRDELLSRVRSALAKLAESPDEFGSCEECGEDIALGRLNLMPYAELCVECQAKQDGPKTLPTRRKLTDYA